MVRQNTRRRTSTRKPKKTRRKNRWLWIPKLILLAACVGLALVLVVIEVMKKESHRTGIFEPETPNAPAVASPFTPGADDGGGEPVEEVSPEERRELEALLK